MTPSRSPANAPKGSSREQNRSRETSWRKTFTYNSQPLPMFSSHNPVDPPRAGANGSQSLSVNERSRETYSTEFKIKALQVCLSLKSRYLEIPPAAHADQEPFWKRLIDLLSVMPLTKGRFKDWREAHRAVESWCQARRSYMRENRLPAVSQSQPELDTLIDEWNLVFAQRFCRVYGGYFENTIWPQFAEDKLKQMVKDEVDSWVTNSLKKRRNELHKLSHPTLLSKDSSLKQYENAVKGLQDRFEVVKREANQVRESEAVMSIVLKLQPDLRTAISQFLGGPTEPTRRTEPAKSTQYVGLTPCSNGTPAPATTSAPPPPSAISGSQIVLPPSTPNTNMIQRLQKHESQGSDTSTQQSGKREEDASRKRKDPGHPARSTEGPVLKGGNTANTVPYDLSKRPRLDNHQNLPPVGDTPRGQDTRHPRSPPFRRLPLPSQPPPWTRNGPDYRSTPRYQDQYRGDRNQDHYRGRYQGGDSYRPPLRGIRETTADFEGMTVQQQNMSLFRQIKKVQDMVEKKT